jgi:zinc protease
MRHAAFSLIACLLLPGTGYAEPAAPFRVAPEAEQFALSNGMQVVVIPDHRAPVVTQMVWYRVGAADEEAGQSGVAHFLEHLMFKGTPAYPGNTLDRRVNEIGGEHNAFTSADHTVYVERVAPEHLAEMMQIEADRMVNLVLTDQVVAPERDVVINERLEVIESEPAHMLSEAVMRLLYLNHPYGRPVIGWKHEIEALDTGTALDFYKRHYAPQNAVLVVAGDVAADEVRRLAERTFGAVPTRAGSVRSARPAEPPPVGPRTVLVRHDNAVEPQLQIAYQTPSTTTGKPGEAEALALLAEILGGGPTSRFYDRLVRGSGLATEAAAGYEPDGVDAGRFFVYAVPKPGIQLRSLETTLREIIAEVAAGGVAAEELRRAKQSAIAEALYAMDDQEQLATGIGEAIATGQSLADVQNWPARIEAVTAQAVQEAAGVFLIPANSATGYLEPRIDETGEP